MARGYIYDEFMNRKIEGDSNFAGSNDISSLRGQLSQKADKSTTYTKTDVDNKFKSLGKTPMILSLTNGGAWEGFANLNASRNLTGVLVAILHESSDQSGSWFGVGRCSSNSWGTNCSIDIDCGMYMSCSQERKFVAHIQLYGKDVGVSVRCNDETGSPLGSTWYDGSLSIWFLYE